MFFERMKTVEVAADSDGFFKGARMAPRFPYEDVRDG